MNPVILKTNITMIKPFLAKRSDVNVSYVTFAELNELAMAQ